MQNKVEVLAGRLAGDKWNKVDATAKQLQAEGKSRNRALADALAKHKCPTNVECFYET